MHDASQSEYSLLERLARALPIVALIWTSSHPAPALAAAHLVGLPHQPLAFTRDDTLRAVAVDGSTLRGPESLSTRLDRLPTASPYLTAGTSVWVLATAYSSSADQTDSNPHVTASGIRTGPGGIAANFLPLGSEVRISGQLYRVTDRLNARYNGKFIIDIWQIDAESARRFGVRSLELEVVSIPE